MTPMFITYKTWTYATFNCYSPSITWPSNRIT